MCDKHILKVNVYDIMVCSFIFVIGQHLTKSIVLVKIKVSFSALACSLGGNVNDIWHVNCLCNLSPKILIRNKNSKKLSAGT